MNYFEELKTKLEGLDEEKVKEIIEFSKKSIPLEFIPKTKYNEKIEELTDVNGKLEETNAQIEELKNSTGDVDEYKTKLDTLTQEYETYKGESDTRITNIKKSSLLKDRLIRENADPENIDLLLKDFNIEEMQLKDDNIVGLDEYVKPIKEKRARLFVKEKIDSTSSDDGGDAEETSAIDNKLRQAAGLEPK